MYGSNYVWILVGPLIRPGFSANGPEEWGDYSGCTVEQVKEASNGYLTLNYDTLDAQNCVTINGKVSISGTLRKHAHAIYRKKFVVKIKISLEKNIFFLFLLKT